MANLFSEEIIKEVLQRAKDKASNELKDTIDESYYELIEKWLEKTSKHPAIELMRQEGRSEEDIMEFIINTVSFTVAHWVELNYSR